MDTQTKNPAIQLTSAGQRVLNRLLDGPNTRQGLGTTQPALTALAEDGLIEETSSDENDVITYAITDKGRSILDDTISEDDEEAPFEEEIETEDDAEDDEEIDDSTQTEPYTGFSFTVSRDVFLEALETLGNIALKKNLPLFGINASILLEVFEDDGLQLTATDLEAAARVRVAASVHTPGEICVPLDTLKPLIGLCPKESSVRIASPKRQYITVDGGDTTDYIRCVPAEEFPFIPPLPDLEWVEISGALMKDVIDHVTVAASGDDRRPILSGALLTVNRDGLTLACADGYRLAWSHTKEAFGAADFETVVPAHVLQELAIALKIQEGQDFVVGVDETTRKIVFKIGSDYDLMATFMQGVFPDYKAIIPGENRLETILTVEAAELIAAAKRAAIFAKDIADAARIEVSEGKLRVAAASNARGDTAVHLEASVDNRKAEAISTSVNIKMMLEYLKVVKAGPVTFKFIDPGSPILVEPIYEAHPVTHHFLQMPMSVND